MRKTIAPTPTLTLDAILGTLADMVADRLAARMAPTATTVVTPDPAGPETMSIPEVAKFLGISEMTVYRTERRDPSFPRRRFISANRKGYDGAEVRSWWANRPTGFTRSR